MLRCHSPDYRYIEVTWTPQFKSTWLFFCFPYRVWIVSTAGSLTRIFFWNPDFFKMHRSIFQMDFVYSDSLAGNRIDNGFWMKCCCSHAHSYSSHAWNRGLCSDRALILESFRRWQFWKLWQMKSLALSLSVLGWEGQKRLGNQDNQDVRLPILPLMCREHVGHQLPSAVL